jgi:uncharacterized protein (DUF486 family)
MRTAVLLAVSNIFMTFAWYGHLRHKQVALWKVIVVSWLIAFFEYCFMVPANRIGHDQGLSGAQLKVMQEAITVGVFCAFAALYLGESLKWNHYLGLGLVLAAVLVVNYPWKAL